MFFYEGFTCPVCGKTFQETDDIVTCPECGAPHHRDCWKQEGHCHYEADHGTDKQWKRPEDRAAQTPGAASSQGKVCPHCGADNGEYAEFCSKCGKELPASDWSSAPPHQGGYVPPQGRPPYGQQPPYGGQPYGQPYGQAPYSGQGYGQPPFTPPGPGAYGEYAPYHMPAFDPYGGVPHDEKIEDIPAEDLVTFTGNNSAYYLPKFHKMSHGGSKVSWNWPAFLITPYWLLFRKNYVSGILMLLFTVAQTVAQSIITYGIIAPAIQNASGYYSMFDLANALTSDQFRIYGWILTLFFLADILLRVLFGCMGNYLYMRTAVSRIRKLQKNPDINYRQALINAGGISFMWGAIAFAVYNFSQIFAAFFFI